MPIKPTYLVAGSGTGVTGFLDGVGSAARFNNPAGIALSNNGRILYVCDYSNNALRAVDLFTKEVTTVAQSNTLLHEPTHCCVGPVSGDIYVSQHAGGGFNGRITRVTPAGVMSVVTTAGQPRGLATNSAETLLHAAHDAGNYFGEPWIGGYYKFSLPGGGLLVNHGMRVFVNTVGGGMSTNGTFYSANKDSRSGSNSWPAGIMHNADGGITPVEHYVGDIGGGGPGGSNGDLIGWQDSAGHHLTLARSGVLLDCLLSADGYTIAVYETVSRSGHNAWGAARNSEGVYYFSSQTMYPDDYLGGGGMYHWNGHGGKQAIYQVGLPEIPPLRQRQRDSIRFKRQDSQQLSPRQGWHNAYL